MLDLLAIRSALLQKSFKPILSGWFQLFDEVVNVGNKLKLVLIIIADECYCLVFTDQSKKVTNIISVLEFLGCWVLIKMNILEKLVLRQLQLLAWPIVNMIFTFRWWMQVLTFTKQYLLFLSLAPNQSKNKRLLIATPSLRIPSTTLRPWTLFLHWWYWFCHQRVCAAQISFGLWSSYPCFCYCPHSLWWTNPKPSSDRCNQDGLG